MILDHSGPDLAALQYAAALKLTLCAAMIASLLNPLSDADAWLMVAAVNVALMLCVAVAVGFVESLVARFKLLAVPQYVLVGFIAASAALLSTLGGGGGAP
jgi:formate hydrogenlyase subunit 4